MPTLRDGTTILTRQTSAVSREPSATVPTIAVSSGEPAGIGPDICCALCDEDLPVRLAVLGDAEIFASRARQLGLDLQFEICSRTTDIEPHRRGTMQVLSVAAPRAVIPGRLDSGNADYVLELLRIGAGLCMHGECDALVTAPVQKSVISESGVSFTGHTEFLAELTGGEQAVMMLCSGSLRVALVTTHLPLRAVAAALDRERIERIGAIASTELSARFGIARPRILVLGLNPHAGEGGTLGDEELTVIEPALAALRDRGIDAIGPVSADTAFTPESLNRCDVVLAMYHDQGLPALKASGFGAIVNVTLGLPILRTSVDHGTALPLAGSGRARHESLREAVLMAVRLARTAGAR